MLRIEVRIIFMLTLGFVLFSPVSGFGEPIQLTDYDGTNLRVSSSPDINASGEIIWIRDDALTGNMDVMLYDGQGGNPHLLTTGETSWSPEINDAGQAAWFGSLLGDFDPASSTAKVFFYNGSTTDHFESNFENGSSTQNSSVNINNSGQLVWVSPRD